ncbi:MAG: alpha/beta fold hydrolase [Alphaproteobacteria bacterium]|nr:alpha/beta fold hydrolase [Alphaproteobacteria bacterium]
MTDSSFATEQITLTCADGQQIAATLYLPQQSNGLSLLINGATGVPRGYYNAFAAFQAASGFTVLTYDYRGIAESKPTPGAPASRMLDWARQDMAAAMQCLARRFPALTLTLVGHSFGGQVLGLIPQSESLAAIVTIASQHGHWRNWSAGYRWKLALVWYGLVPLSLAFGFRLPKGLFGGEQLPRGVLKDWSRWCRSKHYVCDERGRPLRPYNDRIRAAIRMISLDDDHQFGPRKGVDLLAGYYPNAVIERAHIMPADWGLPRIGHFGFFRRDMPAQRWSEIGDWLRATAERKQRAA